MIPPRYQNRVLWISLYLAAVAIVALYGGSGPASVTFILVGIGLWVGWVARSLEPDVAGDESPWHQDARRTGR